MPIRVRGILFILPDTGPNLANPVSLSGNLLNSFEADDKRLENWIGHVSVNGTEYSFPYKYKIGAVEAPTSEYIMVLRLGEQYLIRAEARAHLNKISDSQSDINVIRKRAGLSFITENDMEALLNVIDHERQVELFTEWGHRWFGHKKEEVPQMIL